MAMVTTIMQYFLGQMNPIQPHSTTKDEDKDKDKDKDKDAGLRALVRIVSPSQVQ